MKKSLTIQVAVAAAVLVFERRWLGGIPTPGILDFLCFFVSFPEALGPLSPLAHSSSSCGGRFLLVPAIYGNDERGCADAQGRPQFT